MCQSWACAHFMHWPNLQCSKTFQPLSEWPTSPRWVTSGGRGKVSQIASCMMRPLPISSWYAGPRRKTCSAYVGLVFKDLEQESVAICEIALGVRRRLVNIEGPAAEWFVSPRAPWWRRILLDLVDIFSCSHNCSGDTRIALPGHLVNTHARKRAHAAFACCTACFTAEALFQLPSFFYLFIFASVAIQFKRESRPPRIDLPSVHYVQCPAVNISQLTG